MKQLCPPLTLSCPEVEGGRLQGACSPAQESRRKACEIRASVNSAMPGRDSCTGDTDSLGKKNLRIFGVLRAQRKNQMAPSGLLITHKIFIKPVPRLASRYK